jgi:hypothetical protein
VRRWPRSLRTDIVVGSHFTWRTALSLPAALRNSHRNGGRVFLIFVANPRTVRSCSSATRTGGTSQRATYDAWSSEGLRRSTWVIERLRYRRNAAPRLRAFALQQVDGYSSLSTTGQLAQPFRAVLMPEARTALSVHGRAGQILPTNVRSDRLRPPQPRCWDHRDLFRQSLFGPLWSARPVLRKLVTGNDDVG